MSSVGSRPSVTRSSEVERIIAAAEVDTTFAGKKAIRYRGRRSTWPGALALVVIALGSIVGLVIYGISLHKDVIRRTELSGASAQHFGTGTWIDDGTSGANQTTDMEILNPEEYADKGCELPNYVSKDGKLYAKYSNGKELALQIKGVNWLGMNDNKGVPKGLWDNQRNGNSMYRIGKFLIDNKFNMVRIPLSIDSVLRNVDVDQSLINTNSNRALQATRYIKMLGLIVQGLGQFGLGVVLDFHVLSAVAATSKDEEGLWYGTSIHIDDIKTAISNLATELCNGKYYNIVGIDLKDGLGKTATWGDGGDTDWAAAATTLGNHMLSKCPKWLAFVEGVQGDSHKDDFEGSRSLKWKFFAGSDLSGVGTKPIELKTSNKVVYSPKYWSSSTLPLLFFFDSGTPKGDMLSEYVESSDATLQANVLKSIDYMYGDALKSDAAVVLSSFGGLAGTEDMTAKQTSTRILKYVIQKMTTKKNPLAGGFWWTLNPETYWPYPEPSSSNATNSGLLDPTWREANQNVLKVLKDMNALSNAVPIECVAKPE